MLGHKTRPTNLKVWNHTGYMFSALSETEQEILAKRYLESPKMFGNKVMYLQPRGSKRNHKGNFKIIWLNDN